MTEGSLVQGFVEADVADAMHQRHAKRELRQARDEMRAIAADRCRLQVYLRRVTLLKIVRKFDVGDRRPRWWRVLRAVDPLTAASPPRR